MQRNGIGFLPAVLGSVFVVNTARIGDFVARKAFAREGFYDLARLEHHFVCEVGSATNTDVGVEVKASFETQMMDPIRTCMPKRLRL